jgi:hypothetical protein
MTGQLKYVPRTTTDIGIKSIEVVPVCQLQPVPVCKIEALPALMLEPELFLR